MGLQFTLSFKNVMLLDVHHNHHIVINTVPILLNDNIVETNSQVVISNNNSKQVCLCFIYYPLTSATNCLEISNFILWPCKEIENGARLN